jgi:homoserine kinase
MGSSSAAIVAGVAAGLSFCGKDDSDPATRML